MWKALGIVVNIKSLKGKCLGASVETEILCYGLSNQFGDVGIRIYKTNWQTKQRGWHVEKVPVQKDMTIWNNRKERKKETDCWLRCWREKTNFIYLGRFMSWRSMKEMPRRWYCLIDKRNLVTKQFVTNVCKQLFIWLSRGKHDTTCGQFAAAGFVCLVFNSAQLSS